MVLKLDNESNVSNGILIKVETRKLWHPNSFKIELKMHIGVSNKI